MSEPTIPLKPPDGPAAIPPAADFAPGGPSPAGPSPFPSRPHAHRAPHGAAIPGVNGQVLLGIARHLLTLAGGVLVTRGALDEGQLSEAVGALCALIAIAWSVQHKRSAGIGPAGTVAVALLGVLMLGNGCASPAKVVTADIRLQCGTNVVTVIQPKDTVIDSLEFEPATGKLILRGYQSTASAAAVESARAQAAMQGQVISAGLGVIESLAARAAQSQGMPMAPPTPTNLPAARSVPTTSITNAPTR